jgi:hypothetical protein
MSEEGRRTVEAEREPNFLLARPEQRALRAIARRLPAASRRGPSNEL